MKIVVIGGRGTIGSAVVKELSPRHEVLIAGRKDSHYPCDITSTASIEGLFQKTGPIDAVVVTAGDVHFESLSAMNEEKYKIGLTHKLMGQVNIVLAGIKYLNKGGSFTLTSGILTYDPIKAGSSASMVNGAVEAFVRSAAIEMPHGIRINAVSPSVLTESMPKYGAFFRGFVSVSAASVALGYSRSVEGLQTGQVYEVFR